MKKLRFSGVFTIVVLLAGVLALTGCPPPTTTPNQTTAVGAEIESFAAVADSITDSGFAIVTTTAAVVRPPNPGDQSPEYGVSTAAQTEPTSWRGGLVFTGLGADAEYFIWARAAAKPGYAAGRAFRSTGDTVTTRPEGNSSVTSWEPRFGLVDSTQFNFTGNATVVGGGQAEYKLNTSSSSADAAGTNWQTGRSFNLSLISTDQASTVWARARAGTNTPAGVPLNKGVTITGVTLIGENWAATSSGPVTGTNASVTINLPPQMEFDIPQNLTIEYGLATSNDPGGGSAGNWQVPTDRVVTFSNLEANRSYWLFARTRQASNFASGTPLLYTANGDGAFITTGAGSTTAGGVADQLNAMVPGSASAGSGAAANRVTLTTSVTMDTQLTIASGVTLIIASGATLNTNRLAILGAGAITVDNNATLQADENHLSVPVSVGAGGKFVSIAGASGTPEIIGGANASINLLTGTLTFRVNSARSEYTLSGTAAFTVPAANSTPFFLRSDDLFTVEQNATLTIPDTAASDNSLVLAGTIDVRPGATLAIPSFAAMTATTYLTTGQIRVNGGALLQSSAAAGPVYVSHTGAQHQAAATPVGAYNLANNAQITITRAAKVNEYGTDKPVVAAGDREFKMTLTGDAALGAAANPTITNYHLEIRSGATLLVPGMNTTATPPIAAARTLTVGADATLTVNGTLNLEANATPALGGGNGGKLTINGALLSTQVIAARAGSINVGANASLTLTQGKLAVTANEAVNVRDGGDMLVPVANGKIVGGGTVVVDGNFITPASLAAMDLNPALPAAWTTSGKIIIRGGTGDLLIGTVKDATAVRLAGGTGTTKNAGQAPFNAAATFVLGGASSTFEITSTNMPTNNYPKRLALAAGNATLNANYSMIAGVPRFMVGQGATLNMIAPTTAPTATIELNMGDVPFELRGAWAASATAGREAIILLSAGKWPFRTNSASRTGLVNIKIGADNAQYVGPTAGAPANTNGEQNWGSRELTTNPGLFEIVTP